MTELSNRGMRDASNSPILTPDTLSNHHNSNKQMEFNQDMDFKGNEFKGYESSLSLSPLETSEQEDS